MPAPKLLNAKRIQEVYGFKASKAYDLLHRWGFRVDGLLVVRTDVFESHLRDLESMASVRRVRSAGPRVKAAQAPELEGLAEIPLTRRGR